MNIPHNAEAESAIICACLVDPAAAAIAVASVRSDFFYLPRHRVIFDSILRVFNAGNPVDAVSAASDLMSTGKINEAGGPSFVASLMDGIGSHRTVKHHCAIVHEKYLSRGAIEEARRLIEGLSSGDSFRDVVGGHLSKVSALAIGSGKSKPKSFAEITPGVMAQLEAVSSGEKTFGIPTGFTDIDRRICGLSKKDLIIVAARPSMGKTVFGMQIGINAAKDGHRVLVFSLEMGNEALVARALSSDSRVSGDVMRKGNLNDYSWEKLRAAQKRLDALPVVINDQPSLSISEVRAIARVEHAKSPLGMVIVDYLQLSQADVGKGGNREREVSAISSGLKGIAKELDVPVVALSQLNRSLDSRTDKRPMMSDLRESGAIEQDADVIMFIYRDEVYNRSEDNPNRGIAEIIIGKQRNGSTGTERLCFQGEFSRFDNLISGGDR